MGASIAYYFLIFLPQYKMQGMAISEKENLLNKQKECQKDGMELHKITMGDVIDDAFVPSFKFNEKLNTCLYEGGWFDHDNNSTSYITWFIKDVYTNKEIISYTSQTKNGKTEDLIVGGLVSKEEFEQKEKELFGE